MDDDTERFEELCRYRERLEHFLVHFGRSPEDARDLAQDVLIDTNKHIDRVPHGYEWAYLRVAARNHAINQATRTKVDATLAVEYADPARSAEERLIVEQESRRFRERFHAAFSELSADSQQVVVLRSRGFSGDEIAKSLDLHPTAVRSRQSRAAKHLRERVGVPPAGVTWAELIGDEP